MKTPDFNAEASSPRYTYKKSPVHPRGFMILKYAQDKARDPAPVGDYTVLDQNEDLLLSEKKVMNLVSLMNGRKNLMELGHETGVRTLYQIVTEKDDEGKARVVFYNLGKEGVSVEKRAVPDREGRKCYLKIFAKLPRITLQSIVSGAKTGDMLKVSP